jgi:flagellar basal-body rod modification protein FlgD
MDSSNITKSILGKTTSSTERKEAAALTKTTQSSIGQDDFLKLLVTQLQQQDPLEPMKNEDFAVNLAQFSQLEQLIAIKDSLGSGGSNAQMGLTGYLGQEVTFIGNALTIDDTSTNSLRVTLPKDAAGADLVLSTPGKPLQRISLGPLQSGSQSIDLSDLNIEKGSYTFSVEAVSGLGEKLEVKASAAGIVDGFIPGPEAKVVIGSREVSLKDIERVDVPD